ncbi:GDP-mannose 4,6-dehydratase [Candidatus Kaiserbacteria bacterium CG10_big_fil_rev_8_21_14_0_10_47_16]|uniref:GDP-mannose 4,6-dehydratase n=1 Tax=Candidatus Kaiserbacteria bacterium CG10_big_fil_rev_8_21_14_0_10_47_16 TaxID=1974608 RepID=A0A2H0UEV2_9BACT|nr:MAG: GDP-mannose 4,6-dehydratase [Candidatus Kaiserbacteria bacterium CG10_big_fil_rev_8_21_14_0_10_47_16]
MKKALITGITGQDGSYLAELLLEKGYEVHGLVRRSSSFYIAADAGFCENTHLKNHENLHLHYGDLGDSSSIERVVKLVCPDEVYNLAAMSDVRVSFDIPEYTGDITGLGTVRILEAIRNNNLVGTRMYQASTSELYGKVVEMPQNEDTPFYPRSPYAVSKLYAHWMCKNYKESYGMFISSGILFNHESPRRGPNFVTRKITRGVANIAHGLQDKIYLGNIEAKRDWGYAPEYVEAMWKMLQQSEPDDFVLATGETHTVKEFLVEAFSYIGKNWEEHVEIKENLYRPAEVDVLCGDATKAKEKLKWEPKTTFKDLVKILVDADMKDVEFSVKK